MTAGNERLSAMVAEATRLHAAREGVHEMAGACAIVRGLAELGGDVPWERIERVLAKMRVCARTGFYPKELPVTLRL